MYSTLNAARQGNTSKGEGMCINRGRGNTQQGEGMYTVQQKGEEMCVAAGQGMCTIQQQVEVMYSSRVRECTAAGRGNVQKRGERIYRNIARGRTATE